MDNFHFIITRIESTAAWHRWKAEGFPDDPRSLHAASELDRLAKDINNLPKSDSHLQRLVVLDTAMDESLRFQMAEWLIEEVRAIGVRTSYNDGAELLQAYATEAQRLIDIRRVEPLDHQVDRLSDRLSNHVDANCDAIVHFVELHPELVQEGRATLLRSLQLNANKLMELAQRLR
jgi:hypothetical protein